MAGLVNHISSDGPSVIGIDVMFSERESLPADAELADAIKKAGNVVLATAFIVPERISGKASIKPASADVPDFLWDSAFMQLKSVTDIDWRKWAVKPDKVIPPLQEFSQNASLGHVYSSPDLDGVLRWGYTYVNFGDDCYPQLALQMARVMLGISMKDMILYGGSGIRLGDAFINTDLSGRVLIDYKSSETIDRTVSASDVLRGRLPQGYFHKKAVFIGTSALATYDQKVTPLSANATGVSINANLLENILDNKFIEKSPNFIEIATIVISGILLGLLLPSMGALGGSLIALSLILLYSTFATYMLVYRHLWIYLVLPVSNMFTVFFGQTIIRFFIEEKKAREIRGIFSRYVSPKIVEALITDSDSARLGGEQREITVLFSDVVGFTNLSEKLPPEEVVKRLNEYFNDMVGIIFEHDGTLNKFIGDALMAFWGAPIAQPDHAALAVRCALDMVKRMSELQAQWEAEGKTVIDIGIGINTGEVLVGNIGAEGKQMDYTIIGDNVNLGSRVEALTRKYKVKVLATEFTVERCKPAIESGTLDGTPLFRGIESVVVKGKEQPVGIYSVEATQPGVKAIVTAPEVDKVTVYKEK